MSRSGYCDDSDFGWDWICWRGAVASAIRGKRGQAFLRELLETLDAMPEKRLLEVTINQPEGCCTLGSVIRAREIDASDLDAKLEDEHYYYHGTVADELAERLGIASAMAKEIVYMNDEGGWGSETPEQRWQRMRNWTHSRILQLEDT